MILSNSRAGISSLKSHLPRLTQQFRVPARKPQNYRPMSNQSKTQNTIKASASSGGVSQRHAVLHDFCMCIPYGIFVAAGGLISLLFGCGQPGLIVTAAGVAQIFLANVSLKRWRSGKGSTLYTLVEAGIASAVAYYSWQSYQAGIRRLATGSLFGLSVAAALFFVYNIIAGGNPPRKEEGEKKKE